MIGSDLLAIAEHVTIVSGRHRVPPRPGKLIDGRLQGSNIGMRRSGPLIRIRASRALRFHAGQVVHIGGLAVRLLIALDGRDPASITRIARHIAGCDLSTQNGVVLFTSRTDSPLRRDRDRAQLSPAASGPPRAVLLTMLSKPSACPPLMVKPSRIAERSTPSAVTT